MKVKIFIVALICLIFGVGIVNAQAYRETDRFTGETTIFSTKRRIGMTRARALYFYFPIPEEGLQIQKENLEVLLIRGCLQEHSKRWKYLRYHDLVFLVDGESIIIDETEHSGHVRSGGGGVHEYVYFSISWPNFLRLLDADKVEYRLGAYERKLNKKVLAEMRSFRDEVLK